MLGRATRGGRESALDTSKEQSGSAEGGEALRMAPWSVPYVTKEMEDGEGPWVISV